MRVLETHSRTLSSSSLSLSPSTPTSPSSYAPLPTIDTLLKPSMSSAVASICDGWCTSRLASSRSFLSTAEGDNEGGGGAGGDGDDDDAADDDDDEEEEEEEEDERWLLPAAADAARAS